MKNFKLAGVLFTTFILFSSFLVTSISAFAEENQRVDININSNNNMKELVEEAKKTRIFLLILMGMTLLLHLPIQMFIKQLENIKDCQ